MKKPTKKPAAKKTTRRAVKPFTPEPGKFRKITGKEMKAALDGAKAAVAEARRIRGTKKPAITNKVQELIDKTASVPIEAYIVNAVAKALKKRDDAIMAEIAKIEGIVRRVEEIVAVAERSEILLTKIDAVASREFVVRAGEIEEQDNIASKAFFAEMCAEPQRGVPECVASAVAEIRATLFPDAYAIPATDRSGREVVVRVSRDSEETPFLVDCLKPAEEVRNAIMLWAQCVARKQNRAAEATA